MVGIALEISVSGYSNFSIISPAPAITANTVAIKREIIKPYTARHRVENTVLANVFSAIILPVSFTIRSICGAAILLSNLSDSR